MHHTSITVKLLSALDQSVVSHPESLATQLRADIAAVEAGLRWLALCQVVAHNDLGWFLTTRGFNVVGLSSGRLKMND